MMEHGAAPSPIVDDTPYPWILDHIHSYPGGYEIPLRTMYTLNTSPRAQPMSLRPSRPQSPMFFESQSATPPPTSPSSPIIADDAYAGAHAAAVQLKSNLMEQIAYLPTQPCSLPPDFIISFARKCFPRNIDQVDFAQALTGLDYLRDLDNRRRREIVAVLRRIGIDRADSDSINRTRAMRHPFIIRWIQSLEEKERHVEGLYSQCYIGLRRWILINEMYTTPFNKANCLAMLNTLFPPCPSVAPTPQLPVETLSAQRNGYWRFIQAVEKNGQKSLDNLMTWGHDVGDQADWSNISMAIESFLKESKDYINDCVNITGMESFVPDEEAEDALTRASTRSRKKSHRRGTPKKDKQPETPANGSTASNTSNASNQTSATTATEVSTATKSTVASTVSALSTPAMQIERVPSQRRKVDSGISISPADERPSSAASKDSGYHSPGSTPLCTVVPSKSHRTFGRLARSWRRFNQRRRGPEIAEIGSGIQSNEDGRAEPAKLRKAQSTDMLGGHRGRKMSEPLRVFEKQAPFRRPDSVADILG